MKHIKNLIKRGLTATIALCMILNSTMVAHAWEWKGDSSDVEINKVNYTITTNYIDDEGNAMPSQASTTTTLTGAGKTYTATVPSIEKYVYVGYYINGVGSLNQLSKGEPTVTSKSDASDSKDGKGSYTLNVVYSVDKNDNKIPDKDEHYVITEKFEDRDGNSLPNVADKTVAVDAAVEYFGVVPSIPGYKYVGYYFKADHMIHEGGSLTNLLTGDPYILLNSIDGKGTYVNHMVFEYDDDQYGRVNYDKNASDATGTMEEQKDLLGNEITLSANQFTRPGYLFAGWSTSPTGDVVAYADTAKFMLTQKTTTLYAVWEYDPNQWATISYNKNADKATGTMDSVTVLKNVAMTLSPNRFALDEHLYLGWSTKSSGAAEYSNQATITPTGDMTLYAVWGEPKMAVAFDPERKNVEVGDVFGFTCILENQNVVNSVVLYNAVATIKFNDYIGYVDGSSVVKLNGQTIQVASYNASTNELTLNLGTMNLGDVYELTFNGVGLAHGEGEISRLGLNITGDLLSTRMFRSGASQTDNKISIDVFSDAVSIVPAE